MQHATGEATVVSHTTARLGEQVDVLDTWAGFTGHSKGQKALGDVGLVDGEE